MTNVHELKLLFRDYYEILPEIKSVLPEMQEIRVLLWVLFKQFRLCGEETT